MSRFIHPIIPSFGNSFHSSAYLWGVHHPVVRRSAPLANLSHVHLFRGGPLEKGLQRVLSDVTIGSLLVQSDPKTGEPLLLHVMLPKCIRQRHLAVDTWVFLLDAQVRWSWHIRLGGSCCCRIRSALGRPRSWPSARFWITASNRITSSSSLSLSLVTGVFQCFTRPFRK